MGFQLLAKRSANMVVIFCCMSLLQYHGIRFWTAFLDVFTVGVATSIVIEIVALWSWFQRFREDRWLQHYLVRIIAVTATTLLMIGPLYTVSSDVVSNYERFFVQSSGYEEERALILEEINRKQDQAERLIAVVEERNDGYNTYNRLQDDISALRQELRALERPAERTAIPWQELIIVGMQALAIIILQMTLVIAILKTSERPTEGGEEERREPATETPSERPVQSYAELMKRRRELGETE